MTLELLASDDAAISVCQDSPAVGPFDALAPYLRATLESRGFSELTAVQKAVLDADGEGRDLQISSQTGSGKTVALGFVLAGSLQEERQGNGPQALVIVPTRELAQQVSEELSWLLAELPETRVVSVTGGTAVYRERQQLARGPRVLIGTPGRLLDHVTSGALDLSDVRELVLDEADQMLDMGFREELEGILDATMETRRTHLVSATFPKGIQQLAARYQNDPISIEGTRLGVANKDIQHEGHVVRMHDRYAALVNLLLLADGERTLVFVARRADALEVATMLEGDGFAALPLSGELAQSQRERTLAAFRAGRATVLVATDVAARGLDVPDVSLVIHTTPSFDAQVYTHRSGRTGRAGKSGRSVLLAPPASRRRVSILLDQAGVELQWLPVPSADQVRKTLAERARTKLAVELDAALTAGPSSDHMAEAEELLADREAAPVVAALLARLAPTQRAEPRDISSPKDKPRQREGRRERMERKARMGEQRRGVDRADRADRGARGRSRDVNRDGRFERFFMNWGRNQGATPARLLAAVCRRGQVNGADIGGIAIHPNASTFDVSADVAERFERLASRRDPRDPKTRIRRDRGPRS